MKRLVSWKMTSYILIISCFLLSFFNFSKRVYADSAIATAFVPSDEFSQQGTGPYYVGQKYIVNIVLTNGGNDYNQLSATITYSSNLESVQDLGDADCYMTYSKSWTQDSPTVVGVQKLRVGADYNVSPCELQGQLEPTAPGPASVTISDLTMAYNGVTVPSTTQSYTFDVDEPTPTPTPTATPTPSPTPTSYPTSTPTIASTVTPSVTDSPSLIPSFTITDLPSVSPEELQATTPTPVKTEIKGYTNSRIQNILLILLALILLGSGGTIGITLLKRRIKKKTQLK